MWRRPKRQAVHSLPPEGGGAVQYVTYESLFSFSLVIVGIIGLVLTAISIKKK